MSSSVAAALWICLCLLGACERSETGYYGTTKPLHGPDEVWTNVGAEPEYIDPGKCADAPGGMLITNLFAGLTQAHPKTLQPMPDIAYGWDASQDGLTYTFYLRDAVWSDGVALTAHDFEYAWKRVLARETASRYAMFLYPLKNAEAFNQGRVASSEVGVRAVDDHTLEVTLEDPLPYFLELTTFYTLMPVPRHVIERLEREGRNPDLWTRVENIVSNGPFRLAEWKFRQHMILEKNARYWDAEHVRLRRVRLLMVESSNTGLNLYEAGEIDHIGQATLPAEFLDHLSKRADFISGPSLTTYFYWINTKQKPLDDVRVRQALSLAVDRESLVKYVTRGGQIASADLVPDGVAGYRGLGRPLFDPARARALLAEAGYGPGHPVPTITLRYNTQEQHKQIAEAVQQMWKTHLSVDVQIENQEWKVYLKTLQATEFQLARMGWIGDYADPNTFLELLITGNGNNHSNWSNPEYDALLRRANRTQARVQRLAMLRQVEALGMEQVPLLPLYTYTRSELVKPYLMGHFNNFQSRLLMKHWWIDARWYDGVPEQRLPNTPPPLAMPQPRVPRSPEQSPAALEAAP
jgi:oligopeptide transport system substrate-binding protein